MGLLSVGEPLGWRDTKLYADYIRHHGVQQFIHNFQKLCSRQGDCLKWGDEIEYVIVHFDDVKQKARLSLRGAELLDILTKEELNSSKECPPRHLWRPEYASYMLEGTPGTPYGGVLSWFNHVEDNMRKRREAACALLHKEESLLSIGGFFRLGCPDFTVPSFMPTPHSDAGASRSLFLPDEVIFSAHPRFRCLTQNIRERKGAKVGIYVPIFKDKHTPQPWMDDPDQYGASPEEAAMFRENFIYMDSMGFGMGCCCLQVTFQAVNVCEARWLYDQLTPVTPILLALSASTPVFRGFLSDVDSRWDIISGSVDDRTPAEITGIGLNKDTPYAIPQSRYGYTQMYLYPCSTAYNDIKLVYNEELRETMIANKIDNQLATHIAHLFIRDPIMLYSDRIHLDDRESTEHFENIQSSNWQNMRFKPPPAGDPTIGWRVEFRPTEVQLTDFENAAYVVFVVLLTRVMISFRLSLLIPISKVNENMARAQKRDAVLDQKFYFRSGVATCNTPPDALRRCGPFSAGTEPGGVVEQLETSSEMDGAHKVAEFREMSINEVINGSKDDGFPGLVPLMFQYLDSADVEVDTRCSVQQYLGFIQKRASGEIMTTAKWIRTFIRKHPAYKEDSVVSDLINYDLLKLMDGITKGDVHCPKLLGNFKTKTTAVAPVESPKKDLNHPKFPSSSVVLNGSVVPDSS